MRCFLPWQSRRLGRASVDWGANTSRNLGRCRHTFGASCMRDTQVPQISLTETPIPAPITLQASVPTHPEGAMTELLVFLPLRIKGHNENAGASFKLTYLSDRSRAKSSPVKHPPPQRAHWLIPFFFALKGKWSTRKMRGFFWAYVLDLQGPKRKTVRELV